MLSRLPGHVVWMAASEMSTPSPRESARARRWSASPPLGWKGGRGNRAMASRCCSLPNAASADACSADDVITFEGPQRYTWTRSLVLTSSSCADHFLLCGPLPLGRTSSACADSTPTFQTPLGGFRYWLQRAAGANATKWSFHHMGGGWCESVESCAARAYGKSPGGDCYIGSSNVSCFAVAGARNPGTESVGAVGAVLEIIPFIQ